jgi:hypothetical protein
MDGKAFDFIKTEKSILSKALFTKDIYFPAGVAADTVL